MYQVPYYPGCTLSTKALDLDQSARACAWALDIELAELPDWTCCGASFPQYVDSLMPLIASFRNLAYAKEQGDKLVTICSFCYNVLKRTNRVALDDLEKRDKINDYLERDFDYRYEGEVDVIHFLELLRDEVGFDELRKKVKAPLEGLKVGAYYGCYLLRPYKELGLDNMERPTIFEDFLEAIGCEPVIYPYRTECCGAYLVVSSPEVVIKCCHSILESARKRGADALTVTCPLCFYNLEGKQKDIAREYTDFKPIPVFYFTELMGLALALEPEKCGLEKHTVDPTKLLSSKGIR